MEASKGDRDVDTVTDGAMHTIRACGAEVM